LIVPLKIEDGETDSLRMFIEITTLEE